MGILGEWLSDFEAIVQLLAVGDPSPYAKDITVSPAVVRKSQEAGTNVAKTRVVPFSFLEKPPLQYSPLKLP